MNIKIPKITEEDILRTLNACYEKAMDGIPLVKQPTIEAMAQNYLDKNQNLDVAAKKMVRNQIIKCTTAGFVTGFGGLITLPVTIPANVASVLYVQMRMIACTAYMAGYDLHSDQVQTLVYACLAGVTVTEIVKKFGVTFGEKVAVSLVKKIPREAITAINKKVGFRLLTKFGEKGLINIGKAVPVVGAVVNGGFDLVETKIIAARAVKWFIEGDFSTPDEEKCNAKEEIVDLEVDELFEGIDETGEEAE